MVVTASSSSSGGGGGGGNGGVLFQLKWWRVILDEAHNIRNHDTASSKACAAIKASHRWCLSGTPMQNSISDLYALFRFLHVPSMGASLNAFKEHTKHGTASPELQSLLDCLMLRRRKCDTFGGRPLLPLPPKHIEVLSGRFSEAEQTLYNKIEAHSKRTFMNLMRRNGGVQANYIHILALLTRMRQACNAPQLVSAAVEKLDGLAAEEAAAEEARATTIPVPEEAAKRAEGMAGGEAHDCPICMDMVTTMDGVITACGHPYCRECIAQLIQHSEGRGDGAKCPLCRFTPLQAGAPLLVEAPLAAARGGGGRR